MTGRVTGATARISGLFLARSTALRRGADGVVIGFGVLAATSLLLPEFEAVRSSAAAHLPFVAVLTAVAAVGAFAAWHRVTHDPRSSTVLAFIAFASLAGVYSPHALLEATGTDPAHLVFGPASRATFSILLLASVARVRLPRWALGPRQALALAVVLITSIDVTLHSGWFAGVIAADPIGLLRGLEYSAVTLGVLTLSMIVVQGRAERGRFMASVAVAEGAMIAASLLFLSTTPWTLRWWVAHLGLVACSAVIASAILVERARAGSLAGAVDFDAASSVADLLIDEVDSGVALFDHRGRIVGWNATARSLTGWTLEDAERRFPRRVGHDFVELGPVTVRWREVQVSGANRPMRAVFFSDAGREMALTQENARLEQLRTALEAAIQAKHQLLGVVAHELRNPLAAIGGFAQLLERSLRDQLEETDALLLDRIGGSTEKMLAMVNDLLTFSAIDDDARTFVIARRRCDVAALAAAVVAEHEEGAARKGIELRCSFSPLDATSAVDPPRIEQVLDNLVSNALKYSEAGSTVTVGLDVAADELHLTVTDEGLGIPASELDKLFEPFTRTSVRPTAGERSTGLGLAIVRRLVEAHEGSISVESTVGVGSVFHVVLPRALDQLPGRLDAPDMVRSDR